MKKLATAILLLVYFTVTTGFVVSVHYCMNKLSSVELGYESHADCNKCGMNIQKSDGCCKDDVKLVKMHADHNLAKSAVADFTLDILSLDHSNYFFSFRFFPSHASDPVAHGPPFTAQDTYLLNCVFRL